ncbi:MAG: hypothetical protein JO194_04190 [Candidatus Eremiobacteraeota bacterium]|nr:hypothetical protein [Candidatus Eremiobacteraeota bacterium]
MAVCVCVIAAFALFGGSTRDSQLSVATAAAQPQAAALSLVDRGLAGPAGPDDEGQYRLIDPIGPGGASDTAAQNEVFAPTMIGGQYTRWRPYHDPFAGGGYGGVQAPEGAP